MFLSNKRLILLFNQSNPAYPVVLSSKTSPVLNLS